MTRARALLPLLVLLAALLAHGRSISYGFVFDEQLLIVDNPATRDLSRAGAIFVEKFWPGPSRGVYYRPLVILSYAAGNQVSFASPQLQHAINLLLHGAASVIIFFLLLELDCSRRAAWLAALLFAVHPVHAESVAWVPGRTDVMALLFMAAAWLAWLRSRRRSGTGRVALFAAALGLYLAALLSKEVAVTLPALALVHDLAMRPRDLAMRPREVRGRWAQYAWMGGLTVAFLVWRQWVLRGGGPDPAPNALAGLSAPESVLAALSIFGRGLRLVFVAGDWQSDYFHAEAILGAPLWLQAGRALLALGGLALAAILWRKRPLAAFAVAAIYVSILPVAHLIGFPTLFAERFLYLPSLFACLALALLIEAADNGASGRRRAATILATVMVLLFLTQSLGRSEPFRDDLSFWQSMTRQQPRMALARNWLGITYRNRGWHDRAGMEYRQALTLDPDFTAAAVNLSEVLIREGKPSEAAELLEKTIARSGPEAATLANLGQAYASQGRWDRARDQWDRALALDPDNFGAHLLLADHYLNRSHDLNAARRHLEAARNINPHHPKLKQLLEAYQRETSR